MMYLLHLHCCNVEGRNFLSCCVSTAKSKLDRLLPTSFIALFIVLLCATNSVLAAPTVIVDSAESQKDTITSEPTLTAALDSRVLNTLLNRGQIETLLASLDYPAFAQLVLGDNTGLSAGSLEENADYLRSFTGGVAKRFAGAQWILLDRRVSDSAYPAYSQVTASYRVALGEQMFFVDVRQLYDAHGELKMLDFYNRITEVSAIEYWGNLITLSVKHANAKKIVRSLRGLFDAIAAGQPENAYKQFALLPARLRKNKFLVVAVIEAAERITNTNERLRVLGEMDTKYVKGSSQILLQYYIETQQPEKARAALDSFSNSAAAGAWLQAFEAGVLLQLGDTSAAYARYAEALIENPDSEDVYFNLLDHFVKNRQYADAMLVVRCLYSRFDVYLEPDKLDAIAGYQDFLNYAPFTEWTGYFEGERDEG